MLRAPNLKNGNHFIKDVETRIKVDEDDLKNVFSCLQEKGFTIREISDNIGTNFRNALYKGSSLSLESFRRLKDLYGDSIPHKRGTYIDGEGFKQVTEPDKSVELAELTGLILGDGHLRRESRKTRERHVSNHYLDICLAEEETEIIEVTEDLIKSCLGKEPTIKRSIKSNAVSIRVHGKEIVEALESTGLESGDKIKNQVGVPEWIKEEERFEKACLRGLIDSDGSIYDREDGYTVVYFKNRSDILLEDFKMLSSDLEFKVSSAGSEAVQIASQEHVNDFLNEVSPRKG